MDPGLEGLRKMKFSRSLALVPLLFSMSWNCLDLFLMRALSTGMEMDVPWPGKVMSLIGGLTRLLVVVVVV